MPGGLRFLVTIPATGAFCIGGGRLRTFCAGGRLKPGATKVKERGMSPWRDLIDWVGGYPFEVAKPEAILDFYLRRGFTLTRLTTCGGSLGCNEYVFARTRSRLKPRDQFQTLSAAVCPAGSP